jgi:hypothetical protein
LQEPGGQALLGRAAGSPNLGHEGLTAPGEREFMEPEISWVPSSRNQARLLELARRSTGRRTFKARHLGDAKLTGSTRFVVETTRADNRPWHERRLLDDLTVPTLFSMAIL